MPNFLCSFNKSLFANLFEIFVSKMVQFHSQVERLLTALLGACKVGL